MPQTRAMGCAFATAAVVGGGHLVSTFVMPTAAGASCGERVALRGAVASDCLDSGAAGAAPFAGWGAAVVVAAAASVRAGRTTRRAEPGTVPKQATFDPAKEIGVTQPIGYFDPAGLCKVGDAQGFRNLRVAEIKHGRVAMMAALGAVAQHYVKFPSFGSVPSGLSAAISPPGSFGFVALFLLSGFLELAVWTDDGSKEPGNFGDPVGLNMYTEDMRNKEINNGRMAMFAAIGIIAAEVLTGKDGIEQMGL